MFEITGMAQQVLFLLKQQTRQEQHEGWGEPSADFEVLSIKKRQNIPSFD